MLDQWQCVFADTIKPIGMGYPCNVEFFKENLPFFLYFRWLLLEIIKNDPVVNSFYFCFLSVVNIKKFFSFPYEFCQANHFNTDVVFRRKKIDPGFLFFWKNFKENYIFRVFLIDNDVLQ